MKILISGIGGHMGREVLKLAENQYMGAQAVAGVDRELPQDVKIPCYTDFGDVKERPDCIVDFSHHTATLSILSYAVANKIPTLIATTGQTEEEKAQITKASKEIPIFFAANYSLGIASLVEMAKKMASVFPDAEIEIIEKHHDRKLDAPSGTALAIADGIKTVRKNATVVAGRSGYGKRTPEEIGIHSLRMGNVVGEHEVIFMTPTQSVTLKHEAYDRKLFAEGALAAAAFMGTLPKGSVGLYKMDSLLKF